MVLKLLQHGYHVLAHSSDSHRSKKLQAKCQGHLEVENQLQVTTSLLPGLHVRQWVVGKSDKKVLNYVPQGSKVVVFSVPNPFESGRDDLMVVPGGLLHMDLSKLSKPRQFANLLRNHDSLVEKKEVYARVIPPLPVVETTRIMTIFYWGSLLTFISTVAAKGDPST